MSVDREVALSRVLATVPGFQVAWERYLQQWGPGVDRGLCNDFGALTAFVVGEIAAGRAGDVAELFVVAEDLLNEGDNYVSDVVATCFIESLVNRVPDEIEASSLISLLGPASRKRAESWASFWGGEI